MSAPIAPVRRRRRALLMRFVAFPAVGAISVLATLSVFENRLVYFPAGADFWGDPAGLRFDDVTFTAADGRAIHAWWCPKEGADGALIYCHGNGGNLSMLAREYRQLQEALDVSVLAFDYPGYGRSDGRPSEQGCYAAATAAHDWLTARGIPAERIILFGDSLGGGVAAELATRRSCRALVLYSTFTSVPDVGHEHYPFLPARTFMRNRFDTLRKLPVIARPVFIAHGDADDFIPPAHSRRLYEAAAGPKALHLDPGRRHETNLTPNFLAALRDFLRKEVP